MLDSPMLDSPLAATRERRHRSPGLVVSTQTCSEVMRIWPRGGSWLTGAERGRLARMRGAPVRDAFVAAHILVRAVAAELLSIPPATVTIDQRCVQCGGPHGRPTMAGSGVWLSMSHATPWVSAAASFDPVGVDVEPLLGQEPVWWVLADAEAQTMRHSTSPGADFLRLWTAKESLVKVGHLSLDTMASCDLSPLLSQGGTHRSARWRGWRVVTRVDDHCAVATAT